MFSSIGIVVSFLARNHADVPRFSNYFIMPMAYLCNTFFSTDNIPHGARELIAILPLSQTSRMIRGIASGVQTSLAGILLLLLYLTVCTGIALIFVYQKKNL